MKKGSIQALTPLIHAYILEELTKGTRPGVVTGLVANKWNISLRKSQDHLATVKDKLAKRVEQKEREAILGTLHERCEQQYNDTQAIGELVPRLDLQRKIVGTHADLFGFGRQKGDTTINIDLRGLLPEPIQRALQPITYDEEPSQ